MEWDDWLRMARRHPLLTFGLMLLSLPSRLPLGEAEEFFEGLLRRLVKLAPSSLVRERKLPDGRTVKEFGPFIAGLAFKLDAEGRPLIQRFGNVKPSTLVKAVSIPFSVLEVREPLYELENLDGEIKVVVELPGALKDKITVTATERTLTVLAEGRGRSYRREIPLPVEVDAKAGRSTYADGLLEVYLPKREKPKPMGEPIKVE
ncbi:MAG: Hsp20/alpha crystallin family protein [Candidatus Hecatellaceae archaeon]